MDLILVIQMLYKSENSNPNTSHCLSVLPPKSNCFSFFYVTNLLQEDSIVPIRNQFSVSRFFLWNWFGVFLFYIFFLICKIIRRFKSWTNIRFWDLICTYISSNRRKSMFNHNQTSGTLFTLILLKKNKGDSSKFQQKMENS